MLFALSAAWHAALAILGFFGNLVVFLTTSVDRKLHLKRYVILASLALCDFLCAALILPFRSISRWKEAWVFGMPWCRASGIIARVWYTVTMAHLCAISYDRYRAIVKEPLLYYPYFTQRDLVETVLYLWILPTVIVTIFPLIKPTEIAYNNQTFICEQAWTSQGTTADAKKVFYGFTLFILPLLVIMILNYSVFKTAREKCVEPAGATSQAQITRREKFHQEHRAAIDVFIVVGAFLLLFLPLWVSGIARRFLSKDGLDASLYLIPNDFTLASAVCNPFIYATRKRQFRRAMLSVLRCRGSAAGPVIPQSPAPERWTVPPGPGITETAAGNVAGCSGVHPLGVDRGEVGELANRSNRPLP